MSDLMANARPYSDTLDIRITDSSLRDGSHHKRHQFTEKEVRDIVAALDDAGSALARRRVPTPRQDYDGTVEAVASLVRQLSAGVRAGRKVAAE